MTRSVDSRRCPCSIWSGRARDPRHRESNPERAWTTFGARYKRNARARGISTPNPKKGVSDAVEAERTPRTVPAGHVELRRCPNQPACEQDLRGLPVGPAGVACPGCGAPLLPTDVLRVWEAFKAQGSNIEACSRVMSIAERLISLALVHVILEKRPSMLQRMVSSQTARSPSTARSHRSNDGCYGSFYTSLTISAMTASASPSSSERRRAARSPSTVTLSASTSRRAS